MNLDEVVKKEGNYSLWVRRLVDSCDEHLQPMHADLHVVDPAVSYGVDHLFDAYAITSCPCSLVGPKLQPERFPRPESWRMDDEANAGVMTRWMQALNRSSERLLVRCNFMAMDNEYHLEALVHGVLRLDGRLVVLLFRGLSKERMYLVQSNGAFRKDVVGMISAIYLAECDAGVLVYEHNGESVLFDVSRHKKVFEAVTRKSRKLRDYLLVGAIPNCPHVVPRKK